MIRNIWAVGRNYSDHAKELGNAVPSEPFMFLKAGSSAVISKNHFQLPEWAHNVHHEVELALKLGKNLEITEAAIALDLTERDKQNALKEKGLPWTLAKSFTNSCPLSDFFPVTNIHDLEHLQISLKVNNDLKQNGNTSQMIFKIKDLVAFAKKHFPLEEGDLILTGTPSGVGPLKRGDTLIAELEGKMKWTWKVE